MEISTVFIYLIFAIFPIVYLFFKKRYTYWQNLGIPFAEPEFPYGSSPRFFSQRLLFQHLEDIYNNFKHKTSMVGIFLFVRPVMLALDLDLIKNILVKDFSNFTDRGVFYNERDDPLSAHLFSLDGTQWQTLRKKLSPTFTSGKMKFMYPTVVEIGDRFTEVFGGIVKNGCDIEIKELLARFTTDVIGTCAFGIDCNSLKDPNAKFRLMGKKIFTERRNGRIAQAIILNFPGFARTIGMKNTREDVSEFFMKAVKDTVALREKNNITRNDFMDILIKLKNGETMIDENGQKVTHELTIEQIAAQAFVFFIAGFETSSTTMGFGLYELAKNQDIQNKLRIEIEEVIAKHDGKLTYECINEMNYLEQVLMEILRKYPVVTVLLRKAIADYKVPNTNYIIPKGTLTFIPVRSIHYDHEIYPDPEKFDPERFTPDAIKDRHSESWLPFGDGPRNCIGLRFGKIQTKIGLIALLRNFKFSFCESTPKKIIYNPKIVVLASKDEIILNVQPISR